MILSTRPFGLFWKKENKNKPRDKEKAGFKCYMISFGFGLKCILVVQLKKQKGNSLTGIFYIKSAEKIQQQQKTKILHRYLKKTLYQRYKVKQHHFDTVL